MVINPAVNSNGVISDIFSANLENRVVYLTGEVTDEMAASIVAQLLYLDSKKDECEQSGKASTISLYINSPGGSVSAGLAIYDCIKHLDSEVSTVCMGIAASMGAVILSGGTKGKRYALKHSEIMIHQPSGGVSGQATDFFIAAEHMRKTQNTLYEILADNCETTMTNIIKHCDRDYWMASFDAKEFGIIDEVI